MHDHTVPGQHWLSRRYNVKSVNNSMFSCVELGETVRRRQGACFPMCVDIKLPLCKSG